MLKNLLLATLATTTLFAIAVPAHAGEPPRQMVSHADLDLGSAGGRATLDQRINRAARAVCPASDNYRSSDTWAVIDCRRAAVAGGQTQVAALTSSVRLASR